MSYFLDLEDPDGIEWSYATRTRYPIYGFWAFLVGVDPDPRPIVTCRDLTRPEVLTLADMAEALRRDYGPALRAQLEREAVLLDYLPRWRRRRWWKPWTWRKKLLDPLELA